MHVCRSQVYHYLLSGNPESHRLESSNSPQKAFLHSRISKSHKVQADARSHVYLYSHRNRIDPDTFCRMYVYKHIDVFCPQRLA